MITRIIDLQEGRLDYHNSTKPFKMIFGMLLCLLGYHKGEIKHKENIYTTYPYCIRCGVNKSEKF